MNDAEKLVRAENLLREIEGHLRFSIHQNTTARAHECADAGLRKITSYWEQKDKE